MTKGFTLLELLIVIAILAVLSAVTILVINPAEIMAKARDAQRLSDLKAIKTGIAFYIIATSSPELDDTNQDANDNCVNGSGSQTFYTHQSSVVAPSGWQRVLTTSTPNLIDGSGWIKINFNQLSGGSPLSRMPTDPNPKVPAINPNNEFYYVYSCNATNMTYELMANMESKFYRQGGTGDVESKDGGSFNGLYEIGTQLGILPAPYISYFQDEE